MYDNALKCIESDYPSLLGLAQVLGAIRVVDGIVIPMQGVAWDFIGYKKLENGTDLQDGNGNKYVHVNVRTPFSVGAKAAELAALSPEIATALVDTSKFFVTDSEGNAKNPEFPIRVFS